MQSLTDNNNFRECKFCLLKHKWGKKFCFAAGKTCDTCKKFDHFKGSSVCQGEAVTVVSEDDGGLPGHPLRQLHHQLEGRQALQRCHTQAPVSGQFTIDNSSALFKC